MSICLKINTNIKGLGGVVDMLDSCFGNQYIVSAQDILWCFGRTE